MVRVRKRWGDAARLWSAPGSHPNQEYTVNVSKRVHTCGERTCRHTLMSNMLMLKTNPLRYLDKWFGLFCPFLPFSLQPVFERQGLEQAALVAVRCRRSRVCSDNMRCPRDTWGFQPYQTSHTSRSSLASGKGGERQMYTHPRLVSFPCGCIFFFF